MEQVDFDSIIKGDIRLSEYADSVLVGTDILGASAIYVSPSGRILMIIDGCRPLCKSPISIGDLNEASSNYYYAQTGKAMYLIDLMALNGFLRYSDSADFSSEVNRRLGSWAIDWMILGTSLSFIRSEV